jgi:hypothetical protein
MGGDAAPETVTDRKSDKLEFGSESPSLVESSGLMSVTLLQSGQFRDRTSLLRLRASDEGAAYVEGGYEVFALDLE